MDKHKDLDSLALAIGQRIAARRNQLGLTQEQAAEKIGLSQQFLACVERGLKNMRAENIVKVAQGLKISPEYLLTGTISDTDRHYLIDMITPLNSKQLRCYEEITKNYLIACGYEVLEE